VKIAEEAKKNEAAIKAAEATKAEQVVKTELS
jgi:hypothetical protein